MPRFRAVIEQMPSYVPGRTARDVDHHDAIVKLSANEWSGEPLPGVVEAVARAAHGLNRYPDGGDDLRERIARMHGLRAEHVLLGPGSNTLLSWTALATAGPGDDIVHPEPSFALYPLVAALTGARARPIALDDRHRVDLDAMAAATGPDTRLVFVCNPNNPTSTAVSGEAVAAFIDAVDPAILVAVDEAYGEFGTAQGFGSALPLVERHDNVVVYRTFSKIYGLAGARLGYAVGAPATLRAITKAGVPFAANSLAVAAATAALDATAEIEARAGHVRVERERVASALRAAGHEVAESEANFLYLPVPDGTVEALEGAGVIVRSYTARWIRVTVGSVAENDAFLDAMRVAVRAVRRS